MTEDEMQKVTADFLETMHAKSAMKSNYKIRCASMDTATMSRNMCIKMITR